MEINSILAALFFYLFPVLTGRPLARLFIKNAIPVPFITYFLTGLFMLFAATAVGNAVFSIFFHVPFPLVFQGVIAMLAFILIPINLVLSNEDLQIKTYVLPFIASLALGAGVFFLFSAKSPHPLNWDLYEHQTLAQNMLAGKFSLLPSQITDTFGFDGYSTVFHTLLAASQAFLTVSILPFWNALDFFHLTTVIFASYLLGKSVTGKDSVGYLTAILSGLTFDSTISFTNLFLIPQTFTAVIFIFLFVQLLESVKRKGNLSLSLIIASSIAIFLNHFVVGFAASILYLGSALYFRFQNFIEARINVRTAIETIFILILAAILFSGFIPLGFINKGEAGSFNLSFADKFQAMRQTYGFLPLFLFPIGISFIIKERKKLEVFVAVVTILLLGGILMQFPYIMKFFVLAKFFVSVVFAVGIYRIISNISNKVLYLSSYAILICVLAALFVSNITIWKGILQYDRINSNVSGYEIQAASFLKNTYANKNVLLVSDPATQNILETLSTINTQGGAYMDSSTREKLSALGDTTDASKTISTLSWINDSVTPTASIKLLVLGGRYFEWQKNTKVQKLDLSYNVWYPVDLSLANMEQINALLSNSDKLKLVYQNPGLAIIEIGN